jgi:hypothetical protein
MMSKCLLQAFSSLDLTPAEFKYLFKTHWNLLTIVQFESKGIVKKRFNVPKVCFTSLV